MREIFQQERAGQSTCGQFVSNSSSDRQELNICSIKLDELSGRIQDFDVNNRDNDYKSIKTRLLHIQGRLNRFESSNPEATVSMNKLTDFCNELLLTLEQTYETAFLTTQLNSLGIDQNISQNSIAQPNVTSDGSNLPLASNLPRVSLNRHVSFSNVIESRKNTSSPFLIDLNEHQASSSHMNSRLDDGNDNFGLESNIVTPDHSNHLHTHANQNSQTATGDHLSTILAILN